MPPRKTNTKPAAKPTPAGNPPSRFFIGTSGYSYAPWKGRFYPRVIQASAMLQFYAQRFSTVELNSTFYKMPEAGSLAPLRLSVSDDFRFSVKAPQRITHHLRLLNVAEPLQEFLAVAKELHTHLGPLCFQLPPNFKKDVGRLGEFLKLLGKRQAAFEFRHPSWFDEEVYALLGKRNVALCIAGSEDLETPRVATADFGYLRLRRECYSARELKDWAQWISAQPWQQVFVHFKHEDSARGTLLAAQLAKLLNAPRPGKKT